MNNFKFFNENVLVSTDGLVSQLKGSHKGVKLGCDNGEGYKRVTIDKKKWYVHDLVWSVFKGEIPKGYVVHHINHHRDDNRLDNLELMPKSEHTSMHVLNWTEKKKKKRANSLKGIKRTDEWKRKIGLSNARQVKQIPLDGSPEKVWVSAAEAARQLNCSAGNILSCVKGRRNKCKNSKWEYI